MKRKWCHVDSIRWDKNSSLFASVVFIPKTQTPFLSQKHIRQVSHTEGLSAMSSKCQGYQNQGK